MNEQEIEFYNKEKIVDEKVKDYIRGLVPERNDRLKALEAYAEEFHVPIIQPEVSTLLKFLVASNKPKRILEIGTAIGYSALVFLAEAREDCVLDTIELKDDMVAEARKNLENEINSKRVIIHHGDARDIIATLKDEYDMIFVDAAKGHYKKFFDEFYDMLKPGGVIISDNILYKGMIAHDDYVIRRKITIVKRMRKYLDEISNDDRLVTTVLPIGDGVALSYKKA